MQLAWGRGLTPPWMGASLTDHTLACLLLQLNHPYIIQMLDAFIDENMLIIIFEWAPAGWF